MKLFKSFLLSFFILISFTTMAADGPLELVHKTADDVLTVLLGTLSLDELQKRMANSDALVIMKIGRNIEKIRQALKASDLYQKAWLVEFATMPQQTVYKLSECEGRITPYFSIIVVHGQGRRP